MDSPAIKDLPMNPGGETTAAVAIVVWVLAAIFVGLRFLARRSPVKPGVDDWVSLLSLVPALGLCICTVIWATLGGLGWHTDQLSHRQSMNSLKVRMPFHVSRKSVNPDFCGFGRFSGSCSGVSRLRALLQRHRFYSFIVESLSLSDFVWLSGSLLHW